MKTFLSKSYDYDCKSRIGGCKGSEYDNVCVVKSNNINYSANHLKLNFTNQKSNYVAYIIGKTLKSTDWKYRRHNGKYRIETHEY